MGKITLSTQKNQNITMLPNAFIDHYMPTANGSYVKVYLYLIRCFSDPFCEVSIATIADHLEETEKDIIRALLYWEKTFVLSLEKNEFNQITDITFLPLEPSMEEPKAPAKEKIISSLILPKKIAPTPLLRSHSAKQITAKPSYSSVQVEQLTGIDEVSNLMHSLENLYGRTLNSTEVQLVLYLYESLEFSSELILYLYDYCISKDKKSSSYIESVALAWAEEGIHTVEEAKTNSRSHQNITYCVNKAFGLNRSPGMIEQQYIDRWGKLFGFSEEMITEACNRTLLATGKPDFKYADKILENWKEREITDLGGVAILDQEHSRQQANSQDTKKTTDTKLSNNHKFNLFPQRKYTDDEFSTMEQRLLNRN